MFPGTLAADLMPSVVGDICEDYSTQFSGWCSAGFGGSDIRVEETR